MTDLLFLAFAAVTIGAAILAIEARDLVYGAAALGIAFLGVAGMFFFFVAAFVGVCQYRGLFGAAAGLCFFYFFLVCANVGQKTAGTPRGARLARILVSRVPS